MNQLSWEAIGVIAAIIFGVIQIVKRETPTNDNKTTQSVKGLFFSKNNISQKIEKKDER